ncbi:MAG TPA: lipopolysaccharide biosynthesis protein [Tepidisphaeraceae bacterium]|jgi:O-antigen/teichoic acid export membrane protein|nr:lipopolysaccharide biosynthesis protein [Tepidisphaeraceae bacterium]
MSNASDKDRFFATDHLKSDLKGRSVRGGAMTVLTQVMRFGVNMGTTVVLARMLSPDDFGLVGMLFAILLFVEMFRDMGLSSATIQQPTITHAQVSTLFWFNILFSVAIASVMVAASPLISAFYGKPELTGIGYGLSLMFLASGFGAQHGALLTRQMRYKVQAIVTVIAMLTSSVASIAAAYYGYGYWALVVGYVLQAVVMTIGLWIASGWIPGLPSRSCNVRPMLKYGVNFAAFGFVNQFARSTDSILIGKYAGATEVGLYTKAYQLVLMPILQINTPLTRVAMPALSRLQDEPERYRAFYVKAVGLATFFGMPVVAFLFVAADAAIELMLGSQWGGAVPLFRILGPAAFFGTFNIATGWVYASLGHTDRQFRWGLITSTVTVIAFVIGLKIAGTEGVAAAFSITYCALTVGPAGLWYCFRGTHMRLGDAWDALWRPGVTSIGAAIATLALMIVVPRSSQPFVALVAQAVIYGAIYFGLWMIVPGGRQRLRDVLGIFKMLRGGRGDGAKPGGFPVQTVPNPPTASVAVAADLATVGPPGDSPAKSSPPVVTP